MVPAVNASATHDGYLPSVSEGVAAEATVDSRASLTVVTAEGDRVTLSSNVNAETAVVGYDARGHFGGTEGAVSRSVEATMSLEIDGDLSADERHDLRAVARAFQQAVKHGSATDFYDHVSAADVDSLASVAGEYETTSASVFAMRSSGPSALPARPDPAHIGTPPLARALDLLRSMMIALRDGRPDDEPVRAKGVPAPAGGAAAPLPSNIAEA